MEVRTEVAQMTLGELMDVIQSEKGWVTFAPECDYWCLTFYLKYLTLELWWNNNDIVGLVATHSPKVGPMDLMRISRNKHFIHGLNMERIQGVIYGRQSTSLSIYERPHLKKYQLSRMLEIVKKEV